MQIAKTQNQRFEGAFRISPNEVNAKIEIPQLFTQGRQIFNDILETGDKFVVLRDKYDKRVGKYIQEKGIKGIEYFPEINTKSGLDDEKPEGLLKLINAKTVKVITNISEICKTSMVSKKLAKVAKAKSEVDKVANALRLNIENPQVTSSRSFTKVRDEEKKRTIELIMKDKGSTYVYVKPDQSYEDSTKCIIDGKGNIVKKFETPEEIMRFMRVFHKLKQEKVNILADK